MVHRPFRPKWASRAWALLHLSRSDDDEIKIQLCKATIQEWHATLLANLLSTSFDASSLAWSLPPWCSDNHTSKSVDIFRLPHRNARMPVAMKSCWIQQLSQCRTHCILPLLYLEPKCLTTREEGNKIEELNSFQEIKGPPSTVKKVWPRMGLVKLCP